MSRNLRWTGIGALIALPVIFAIIGIKILQFKTMGDAFAQMVMPPTPVNSIKVREEQWQPRISAVGSVMAMQGTVISNEAAGVVREIRFEAGSVVKAGDILVLLDSEVEQAQLRSAEAAAELARISFDRAKDLISKRSISQADLDSADARLKEARAQVDYIKAVIGKKTVRAPFAGRLGIRSISVGEFLEQGRPVVSLQSLDPVYVEFSLPQQRLGDITEGLKVEVTTDSYPGRLFQGEVTAVNPNVDLATRNVRVQATFANSDEQLRPGMFVSVDIVQATAETMLFIPATAVMHAPFGDSVYLIQQGQGPDGKQSLVLEQKIVRLGARQGDYVVVLDGVEAGETIVSTGVFKLQPGMPVVIDNTLAPEFAFEPKPRNT
jgi:membrane fusion protein (multidrug efflux system)